jgi:hypothetical protein
MSAQSTEIDQPARVQVSTGIAFRSPSCSDAPRFDRDTEPRFDRNYGSRVHDYYGLNY